MFRSIIVALSLASASAFVAPLAAPARSAVIAHESKADLEALAVKSNPSLGYFDPLGLGSATFWDETNEATIGFLRHAEIKHGRIAMFAFCGFIAGSNGVMWPWPMTTAGDPFPFADGVPGAQWDSIPYAAQLQIVLFAGIMEFWSEGASTHYMRGGQAGKFPSFKEESKNFGKFVHPMPFDLFDPFGLSKKKSAEAKAKGLVSELNNGRLAQIGIFGFLCESKIPGSVPMLSGIIKPYAGEYMEPFAGHVNLEGIIHPHLIG